MIRDVLAVLTVAAFFGYVLRRPLGRLLKWLLPAILRHLFAPDKRRTGKGASPKRSARWIPPGERVVVHRMDLEDGMIYWGQGLATLRSDRVIEPALVDPELPIDRKALNPAGVDLGRWASYTKMSPGSRATYLDWLSSGRSRADVALDYVWTFFGGLERRVLVDAERDPAVRAEIPALRAELLRLIEVYGGHDTFRRRARRLWVIAGWIAGERGWHEQPPLRVGTRSFGLDLQLAIAELAAAGEPLDSGWALAWYKAHPDLRSSVVERRCEEEFDLLFELRYRERHPDGLSVPAGKKPLVLEHDPASSTFPPGARTFPARGLTQAAQLGRVPGTLEKIAAVVAEELKALSRHRLHHPGDRSSMRAQMLLPAPLLERSDSAELQAFRAWLDGLFKTSEPAVMPARDLLHGLGIRGRTRVSKGDATEVIEFLARLGAGIEPDVTLGGSTFRLDDRLVLFPLADERTVPGERYRFAQLLVQLATQVAQVDSEAGEHEQQELERHIESALELADHEARRLKAFFAWQLAQPASLRGTKRLLDGVDRPGREMIGRFMVTVAIADGEIDAGERKILQRLFKLLELEDELLEAEIKSYEKAEPETADPTAPADRPAAFRLDLQLVQQKLRETREVSRILASVFVEEPEPAPATAPEPTPEDAVEDAVEDEVSRVAGLDAKHSMLLRTLEGRVSISREDFDELAESAGLLPSGALDRLNEAAFECCDEALLEGVDPLDVRAEILDEMLQAEETSA